MVIGDGHAALDCARVCKRWDKYVTIVFETIEEELAVYNQERELAKEEQMKLQPLTKVTELIADEKNFVRGLKCLHMDFVHSDSSIRPASRQAGFSLKDSHFPLKADQSRAEDESERSSIVPSGTGKWQLMAVPDSEFVLEADTVVIALGKKPSPMIRQVVGDLKLNSNGTVWINPESGQTSRSKIFAAGDVATGAGQLVDAMASGKKAAKNIERFLKENKLWSGVKALKKFSEKREKARRSSCSPPMIILLPT